jgi:predicted ATPase/DNA-binding SARP family transcriptional activator
LQCFSALRAQRQNGEGCIERFRTQKTAALLALLALRGEHSRELVCTRLWPDAAPDAARNSLSAALSTLRRDLGEGVLCADRQNLSLASGTVETDVAQFDRALKHTNWTRAVELYRGPLLPGFHEEPFPALHGEYDEKARFAFTQHLSELETVERSSAQTAETLRQVARRAITLFGDNERWFLSLMRAHQMAGDLDAAIRTYETLLRRARKEGEVASETARQLAKTLRREKEQRAAVNSAQVSPYIAAEAGATLAGATPIDAKTVAGKAVESSAAEEGANAESAGASSLCLPLQWTKFFGREAERSLLSDWLGRGERLVTITGAGGSGKTRLAIETLRDVAANWYDEDSRACYVPLVSLQNPDLLFAAIRDALKLPTVLDASPLQTLERALGTQRVLLLLDNFEQLMPHGAGRLQQLREKLPAATLIVTSRVLLRLPGEREFSLSPLPTPLQHSGPDEVIACASVALFCDRAALRIDEKNSEAIGALCRRLDGIPLALELAAARARVLSPAQIVERLERRADFLQSRELGVPARHQTLGAAIAWSVDLLPEELRNFFVRLSVFRGGWTLQAAEEVCDEFDALESLTLLRESSLVLVDNADEQNGQPRFRMLETLREFGQSQLQASDRQAIEYSFFHFYLKLAQHVASAVQGAQMAWLRCLDAEQDNLRAALSWALRHDTRSGLQMATALIDFWETRLNLDEGRHWIETFLDATAKDQSDSSAAATRARALTGAGRLAWYASEMEKADTLLKQGLAAAQAAGDSVALVDATRGLTRLSSTAGNDKQARELGREGVRLARQSNDAKILLKALLDQAFADVTSGDFASTHAGCEEAFALARVEGDEAALALSLNVMGIACDYQERIDEALALTRQSEAIARRIGAQWELMVSLNVQAHLLSKTGDLERAQTLYNETLAMCRSSFAGTWTLSNTLLAVSYNRLRLGDVFEAAQLMGTVEATRQSIGYTLMPVMVPEYERCLPIVRETLGEAAFQEAWKCGLAMTPEAALELAIRPVTAP